MTDFFRAACEIVGGDGAEKAAKAVSGPEIDREAVARLASAMMTLDEFKPGRLAQTFALWERGSFHEAQALGLVSFTKFSPGVFEAALLLLVADYVAERRAAIIQATS